MIATPPAPAAAAGNSRRAVWQPSRPLSSRPTSPWPAIAYWLVFRETPRHHPPEPAPASPEEAAREELWAVFEATDVAEQIALFRRALADGLLDDGYAYDLLALVRETAGRVVRSALAEELRVIRPLRSRRRLRSEVTGYRRLARPVRPAARARRRSGRNRGRRSGMLLPLPRTHGLLRPPGIARHPMAQARPTGVYAC